MFLLYWYINVIIAISKWCILSLQCSSILHTERNRRLFCSKISVVCLTEDQEDGDLILDLMVDGINMVSYTVAVLFGFFSSPIYEE
jgi:hypothetical protein